jgi:hypothetical protein
LVVGAWLLPEGSNWVAVAPDFDLVTQGQDEGLALHGLERMVLAYVRDCAAEGLGPVEARRPIPVYEHLRFHLRWLVSSPARWLRRGKSARKAFLRLTLS